MVVCGEVGWCLRYERQVGRRGSGVRNWGRRGMEKKKGGGGGGGGMRYKDFYE